jgi:hypothetical protein
MKSKRYSTVGNSGAHTEGEGLLLTLLPGCQSRRRNSLKIDPPGCLSERPQINRAQRH